MRRGLLMSLVSIGPCRNAQGGEIKNCYVSSGWKKQMYKKFIDLHETSQGLLSGTGLPV